jgi:hypothetical protein
MYYIYVITASRRVSYKLYIGKITCKSIESIFIFHHHEFGYIYMITLESDGMLHSKKITYSNSKFSIPQNERKQTRPLRNLILFVGEFGYSTIDTVSLSKQCLKLMLIYSGLVPRMLLFSV